MPIVYLDQCAISSIAKAKDTFWVQLHGRLRTLTEQGLIICPTSPLHDEESLLSDDWRDQLRAVCRELAGPYRFRPLEDIEVAQLRAAIRAFLGAPEGSNEIHVVDRTSGDHPHPPDASAISGIRQRKAEALRRMERMIGRFHDFELARVAEIRRYADKVIRGHAAGAAIPARIMQELEAEALHIQPHGPEPRSIVRKFFESESVQAMPFLDLWSRLWATVAQHIHSDVKPRRLKPNDIYDVRAISYYGPYCDAMFLDNEFRKLACQRNVDVPGRYGTQLFSETNRKQFETNLGELVQRKRAAYEKLR